MNAYQFMSDSPILAFLIVLTVLVVIEGAWGRLMRHLNIRRAGWPPAHLDADGEFKPQPKAEGKP